MKSLRFAFLLAAASFTALSAQGQASNPCAALGQLKLDGVEITATELVVVGKTIPSPNAWTPAIGPFPAYCRVEASSTAAPALAARSSESDLPSHCPTNPGMATS